MWNRLVARFKRIGLQWRIMIYVTAGLAIFSAIYGLVALQAVQQATQLVFQERLSVARSLARELDERLAQLESDLPGKAIAPWSSANNSLLARTYLRIASQIESILDLLPDGYHVELLNESGIVVYGDIRAAQFTISSHQKLIERAGLKQQSGTLTHSVQNGEHIIAFAPLSRLSWTIIVEQSADEAFALPRRLQTQFFAFGLFTIVAGLLLAFLTTSRVVHPVNTLIHASKEIARGNLDHPLDEAGEGEIGTLARTFGEMRARLKESRAEIAQWSRELEARVEQRTRELRALVESSHALTSTLHLDALFEILIREARGVLPAAEGIALFLLDNAAQGLLVRSSFGFNPQDTAQFRFRIGEGIAGKVFETEAAALLVSAADVRAAQTDFSHANRRHFESAIGNRSVQSALGAPLISKGTRLGALMAYSFSKENAFSASDVPVLQAFADQAAAAIENAELYAALKEKEKMRAYLLEKVIEAQEEERKRIARELHDELAQTLTALTIELQASARQLPPASQRLKEKLNETETLTTQTLKEMSQLILELRPSVLDDLGLVPAIRRYAENRLESVGTRVSVEAMGMKQRLPATIETTLFRIVQEAVSNTAKYARAAQVSIRLKHANGTIQVEVEDDGVGFDADDAFKLRDGWRGLGLLGMRERAALLGGTLAIDSRIDGGTRVRVEVPWKEQK